MSKKEHRQQHRERRDKEAVDEAKGSDEEYLREGSARRRLKKLSQVNLAEEVLQPEEEEEDNPYLVKEDELEEKRIEPKGSEELRIGRATAEQHKMPKKHKPTTQLDRFIQKQNDKLNNKKEEKPKVQMTIESMMRFKKEPKKKHNSSDEFVVPDDDISEQPSRAQDKRISAYEKYNGSMDDEQKLLDLAIKLSLGSPDKHQNLNDYAYQQPKPSKQAKTPSKSIPQTQHQKQAVKDKQPKSQAKKEVKRTKSMSKQPKTGPLAGFVIAFTGGYEGIDKDKLIEVCEQLGAQCPKSITKKCNLLMQGSHVEDQFKRKLSQPINQTNKSKEALQKGITIIPFHKIDDFFVEKTGITLDDHINKNNVVPNTITAYIKPKKEEGWQSNQVEDGRLWTEKYKPTRLQEVIGESSQIKSLRQWLEAWDDIHLRGNKRDVKEAKGSWSTGNINSPAALISGDPGIGKTTTARLLAIQYNYSVTEFNASDVRNKGGVNLLESNSYNLDIAHNLTRPLIIMDQVDGMSSGDRGGITAIISMLKATKVPIICICNDRSSEKIRSLAGHCLDIKFHKPHKGMIVKRLKEILLEEGGSGEDRALQQLVETFQNDMRQLLTYLEVIFKTVSKRITVDALSNRNRSAKDPSVMITPFDAARKLLNRSQFNSMKISLRTDCFFVDSDLVPIMIHENLLTSARKTPLNPAEFHQLVEGVQGMVIGDMLDRTIRKEQQWGLMPSYGFMTCVYSTEKISQSMGFPQFPSWLGKFSSERKMKRLSKEFKNAIFPATAVSSWRTAKNAYAPLLTRQLSELLKEQSVEEAVILMEQYRISPSIISEHLSSLYCPNSTNPLSDVPSAVKAKLTRLFNKRHEEERLAKIKGKGKQKAEQHVKFDPLMEEPEQQPPQEEPEEEKEKEESLPKVKAKSKPKQSKKPKK